MRGWKPVRKAAMAMGVMVLAAGPAGAATAFDLLPVDNSSALTGYVTYDLQVTTDTDWTSAGALLELSAGSIYQHPQGLDSVEDPVLIPYLYPQYPAMVFDTYVTGYVAGGAGDLGGTGLAVDEDRLDVSWFNTRTTDVGTTTIGRLTLSDDAAGNLSMLLYPGGEADFVELDITIAPGLLPVVTQVVEETEETTQDEVWVEDEPAPYVTPYDDWFEAYTGASGDGFIPFIWQPSVAYDLLLPSVRMPRPIFECPTLDDYVLREDSTLATAYPATKQSLLDARLTRGRISAFLVDDDEAESGSADSGLPEPATLGLFGLGLGVWALRRG